LVPALVPLVIVVHTVQPRWVLDSLDQLTTGPVTMLNPVDFLLVPFVLMAGPAMRRAVRATPWSMPLWIGALLVVGGLLAVAVHPSVRGGVIVLRLIAGLGMIWLIAQFSKEEFLGLLALPIMAVAFLEGILAFAQLQTESAILPDWTGAADPVSIDGVARAAGTLGDVHEMVALGLIAVGLGVAAFRTVPLRRRRLWLIPIAASAVPVAISFSRAALLSALLIVGTLLWGMLRETRDWGPVVIAIAVGLAIPAAIFAGSWATRVEHSIGGAEESGRDVRIEQLEQVWSLVETDWPIGVGPGLYTVALEERVVDLDVQQAQPVQSVPVYVAAEDGAVVGGLLVLMFLALAINAGRRSTENRMLYVAPLAVGIFDAVLYTSPTGLLMSAWWLGGLAALESRREL
jgi:hypothetical protein